MNVLSGRVVRALVDTLLTSKGHSSNPHIVPPGFKFHSMDIVKLDAVQLYKKKVCWSIELLANSLPLLVINKYSLSPYPGLPGQSKKTYVQGV